MKYFITFDDKKEIVLTEDLRTGVLDCNRAYDIERIRRKWSCLESEMFILHSSFTANSNAVTFIPELRDVFRHLNYEIVDYPFYQSPLVKFYCSEDDMVHLRLSLDADLIKNIEEVKE